MCRHKDDEDEGQEKGLSRWYRGLTPEQRANLRIIADPPEQDDSEDELEQ